MPPTTCTSACPPLENGDFPYELLSVETSDAVLDDPEDVVVLNTETTPAPYCLTPPPGYAPWILLDFRLLYHVTGLRLLESSVLSVTVSHGTDRGHLTVHQPSVSQEEVLNHKVAYFL